MKKIVSLMLVLAMSVCLFAACGEDDQKETEPQVQKVFELGDAKITAENISPYEGAYLEYGDVEQVSGLCAMKFTNTGDKTIQNAQIIFTDGTQELSFWLEMLPAGQSVAVVEQNQLAAASEEMHYVDGEFSYLEDIREDVDCVQITGGKDGMVQVKNVTDEMLPLVRVFFRPADENGDPLGGPCKSFMVDGIEAGATVDAAGEGWDETCIVVTVLVVDE